VHRFSYLLSMSEAHDAQTIRINRNSVTRECRGNFWDRNAYIVNYKSLKYSNIQASQGPRAHDWEGVIGRIDVIVINQIINQIKFLSVVAKLDPISGR
jgi:hypothetical protein